MRSDEECSACEHIATNECERCARPLCDNHRPALDWRCFWCEADYARDGDSFAESGRTLVAMGVPLVIGMVLFSMNWVIGLNVAIWGMLVGGGIRMAQKSTRRGRFLAERKLPELPAARALTAPGIEAD